MDEAADHLVRGVGFGVVEEEKIVGNAAEYLVPDGNAGVLQALQVFHPLVDQNVALRREHQAGGESRKTWGKKRGSIGILKVGKSVELRSAKESIDAGIGVIYQEYNLVPTLSVAENIFLGQELTKGKYRLDREAMSDKADAFIKEVGFEIDSRLLVRSLSVAQEQMVEILKALFHKTKILVMDEPTSVRS